MLYVLLALAAITPVLYMPGSGGFEAPKSALFLLLGGIAVFFAKKIIIPRNVLLPAGTVIVYTLVRSYFVTAPNLAWLGSETSNWGAIHWLFGWILLVLATQCRLSNRARQQLLAALGIGLMGILLVVVAQKTGIESIEWLLYDDPVRGRSLIGSIGSSGQLGLIIATISVILLPLRLAIKKRPLAQLMFISMLTVAAVVTLLTKSQSGIIILITGALLHLLNAKQYINRRGWIGIFILISLLPVLAIILPTPGIVKTHAPSFAARIDTWKTAGQGIAHRPIFGAGIEQFPLVYDRYNTTVPANPTVLTEEHPHSLLIELLVEWGVIGLFLIVALYYSLLRGHKLSYIHLPGLAVWLLAAQTNVMTVTLFALGIIVSTLLIKQAGSSEQTPLAAPRWVIGSVATALAVLALAVGSGGIAYAISNDRGVRQSTDYLFLFAANTYSTSLKWPFPRSYNQLEYAEAYTNNALKYQDFEDSEPVIQAINSVLRGSPTARNLIIASQILGVWNEHAPSKRITQLNNEVLQIIKTNWGSTPRFQSLITKP